MRATDVPRHLPSVLWGAEFVPPSVRCRGIKAKETENTWSFQPCCDIRVTGHAHALTALRLQEPSVSLAFSKLLP